MNKNPINTFFFLSGCDQPSFNYPGLIDAIYLVFFNDRTSESQVNQMLMAMIGVEDSSYKMISAAHGKWDKYEDDESTGNFKRLVGECSHLTFQGADPAGWGPDSGLLRIPINVEKSSFSSKSQGEYRGITYASELNVVLEERSSQVSELMHALHNTGFKIGVMFRDANGDVRLMADPHYPMKIETSDESGEGPTGTAAATIKFSQTSKLPPIYYKGVIDFGQGYGNSLVAEHRLYADGNYTSLDKPIIP